MLDRDYMRGYFGMLLAGIPQRQRAKRLERFEEAFSGAADLIRTRRAKPGPALIECLTAIKGVVLPKSFVAAAKKWGPKILNSMTREECADDVLEFVRCAFEANEFLSRSV